MLVGGVIDLFLTQHVREVFTHLGYPFILARILGVWKLLGVSALLAPGWPRLKEWAYAGFMFDLTSAGVSHMLVGDRWVKVLSPAAFLVLLAVSYRLRPQGRRLPL